MAYHRPEFLNAILAHMDDALFVNKSGRIAFVNEACVELFGASGAEALIGRSPLEFFHPDEHAKIGERVKTMHQGARVPTIEERIIRLDGEAIEVEVTAGSFVYDGEPSIVVMLRDITARKATERQLQRAQRLEAIGQLTGGMAHDFNNLLAIVIGNLDLLEEKLADRPDDRAYVTEALSAALRGSELTRQLLAFSRRQPLWPQRIDLNELICGISELSRRTLGEAIDIQLDLDEDLWLAEADPTQLESAILNLVINARDAMPSGGTLTIETRNMTFDAYDELGGISPGEYSLIAVSDTGCGMEADVAARVFEPFYTTKAAGAGSGLGLSMVYGFAQQSGGHVRIYSEVGEGTVVRLFLPRTKLEAEALAAKADVRSSQPGSGETVLLVEDNEGVRRIVERQLKELGYKVLLAGDGNEALGILDSGHSVDLLFTDVVMPGGMDGFELSERASAKYPQVKILHTSGFTQRAASGKVNKPTSLLTKPYRKAELAAKLQEILNGE